MESSEQRVLNVRILSEDSCAVTRSVHFCTTKYKVESLRNYDGIFRNKVLKNLRSYENVHELKDGARITYF